MCLERTSGYYKLHSKLSGSSLSRPKINIIVYSIPYPFANTRFDHWNLSDLSKLDKKLTFVRRMGFFPFLIRYMLGPIVHSSRISMFSVRWLSYNVKVSFFFLLFCWVPNQSSWVSITTYPKSFTFFPSDQYVCFDSMSHFGLVLSDTRSNNSSVYISILSMLTNRIQIYSNIFVSYTTRVHEPL